MKVVWMRTEDGETVFEDLEFDSVAGERGFETPVLPIAGVIFRTGQPELDLGFHNAPRRQIVMPLTGEVTVASGDGTERHISPGEALLADDLTGRGHTSIFRPANATMAFLVLSDDFDPPSLAR